MAVTKRVPVLGAEPRAFFSTSVAKVWNSGKREVRGKGIRQAQKGDAIPRHRKYRYYTL